MQSIGQVYLNEIKNRGVKDILIMCSDGLKGLKEAIGSSISNDRIPDDV